METKTEAREATRGAPSLEATKPYFRTERPNAALTLYEGPFELLNEDSGGHPTTGSVQLEWLPTPRLIIRTSDGLTSAISPFPPVSLKVVVPGMKDPVSAAVMRLRGNSRGTSELVCRLLESVEIGGRQDLNFALLHLSNFSHFHGSFIRHTSALSSAGRIVLDAEGWRLTIDETAQFSDYSRELDAAGGYLITHVVKLERSDGSSFASSMVLEWEEILYRYLSFARGFWVASMLAAGFTDRDSPVWQEWNQPIADSWQPSFSWFSRTSPQVLGEAFEGFVRRWREPFWREVLSDCIWWYIAGNTQAGGVQGSIALVQFALERLAWGSIVEDQRALSADGFDKLSAADKLRLLLAHLRIPKAIPSELPGLRALSTPSDQFDGPRAFTEIRNRIVHPPRKKNRTKNIPFEVEIEAWKLGLWYLELAILRLCNHNGGYLNRLLQIPVVQPVPWATQATTP